MKKLFNYCFYRIALFYKNRLPLEDYITQGHTVLISAIGFYTIALTNVLLFFCGKQLTKGIVAIIIIPFCIIVLFNNTIFPNSKQLFEEKKEEFKQEKYKWFKGFLVLLFVLGSVISMFLVIYLKKIIS